MAKKQEFPDLPLISDRQEVAPQMCRILREALEPVAEGLQGLFCEDHGEVGQPLVDLGILNENLEDATAGLQSLGLDEVCTAVQQVLRNLEGVESEHAQSLRTTIDGARRQVQEILTLKAQAAGKEHRAKVDQLLGRLNIGSDRGAGKINPGDLVLGVAIGGKFYLEGPGFSGVGFGPKVGKSLNIQGEPLTEPTVAIARFDGPNPDGDDCSCTLMETIPQKWIAKINLPGVYSRARETFFRPAAWSALNEEGRLRELMSQVSTDIVAKEGDIIVTRSLPVSPVLERFNGIALSPLLIGPEEISIDGVEHGFSPLAMAVNPDKFGPGKSYHIARIARATYEGQHFKSVNVELEILAVVPDNMKDELFGVDSDYHMARSAVRKRHEMETVDSKIKYAGEDIEVGDYIIARVHEDGRCTEIDDQALRWVEYDEDTYPLALEFILHMDSRNKTPGCYVVRTFGGLVHTGRRTDSPRKANVSIIKPASKELMERYGYLTE